MAHIHLGIDDEPIPVLPTFASKRRAEEEHLQEIFGEVYRLWKTGPTFRLPREGEEPPDGRTHVPYTLHDALLSYYEKTQDDPLWDTVDWDHILEPLIAYINSKGKPSTNPEDLRTPYEREQASRLNQVLHHSPPADR